MSVLGPSRRSPIARELAGIAAIVSCFAVGVSFLQWKVRARVETITSNALVSVRDVDRMRLDLQRCGLLLHAHPHETADPEIASLKAQLQAIEADFDDAARQYAPLATFPDEAATWAQFQQDATEPRRGFHDVVTLESERRGAEAQARLDEVSRRLYAVDAIGERLERINTDAAGAYAAEVRKTLAVTNLSFVLVSLLVMALVLRTGTRELRSRLASNEQLQHANRLATVGQLAAGVAHELGSPLQVVTGRAKMVATGESEGSAAREAGQIILDQARRMTQIIRGLLDFARRRPARPALTTPHGIAQETVGVLTPIARKKAVNLDIRVERPSAVRADAGQIQQALVNLVMNAIQAVNQGGHVTLIVGRRQVSPPVDHGGAAAEYAWLAVKDDGPGISEEHQKRLFEPFFTTKDVGEGTGLGLAIAQGLVRENGGWVAVESRAGHGACFSIFLPSIPGTEEQA